MSANISAIFFADDIVLIAKSENDLHKLFNHLSSWSKQWKLDLSVKKSKVMTMKGGISKWKLFNSSGVNYASLDEILSFKYLGVQIQLEAYKMYKNYNANILKLARNYLYNILSLKKSGPDVCQVARTLWTNCATPAILYGVECSVIKKETIDKLEKMNSRIGKFILQLPSRSTNVAGVLDTGLKSFKQLILERQIKYHERLLKINVNSWTRKAYLENIKMGKQSQYIRNLINNKIETLTLNLPFKIAKQIIGNVEISSRKQEMMKNSKSMVFMSQKTFTFNMKPWINDSVQCKTFSEFRASDAGLGNREPLSNGINYKICILCKNDGKIFKGVAVLI